MLSAQGGAGSPLGIRKLRAAFASSSLCDHLIYSNFPFVTQVRNVFSLNSSCTLTLLLPERTWIDNVLHVYAGFVSCYYCCYHCYHAAVCCCSCCCRRTMDNTSVQGEGGQN